MRNGGTMALAASPPISLAGELMAKYPLGQPATAPEVADLFVYLASYRSAYGSSALFTDDGGITSKCSV